MRRAAVEEARAAGLSERRACCHVGQPRATEHYCRRAITAEVRGQRGRRRRFSVGVRAAATAIARSLNQPISRTARELGLSPFTLHDWLRREEPVVRPVVVAPESASSASVAIVTPTGFRIEGLDEAAVVRVLRALS
jgi:hypothetical protein